MAIVAAGGALHRGEDFALGRVGMRFGFWGGRQAKALAEVTSEGEIVGRVVRIQFGIESGDFE
jgi:hypothetical protein